MKYLVFVKQFKMARDKEEFLKKHITTEYLPYIEKCSMCEVIVDRTMYTTIPLTEGKVQKVFHKNTPQQWYLFSMMLLQKYTDIEFNWKNGDNPGNAMECYDELSKYNIFDMLFNLLGSEFVVCDTVLKMYVDDIFENERSMTSYLDSKITAMDLSSHAILDGIQEIIENKYSENNEVSNITDFKEVTE